MKTICTCNRFLKELKVNSAKIVLPQEYPSTFRLQLYFPTIIESFIRCRDKVLYVGYIQSPFCSKFIITVFNNRPCSIENGANQSNTQYSIVTVRILIVIQNQLQPIYLVYNKFGKTIFHFVKRPRLNTFETTFLGN